jgi:hypothetical protein
MYAARLHMREWYVCLRRQKNVKELWYSHSGSHRIVAIGIYVTMSVLQLRAKFSSSNFYFVYLRSNEEHERRLFL